MSDRNAVNEFFNAFSQDVTVWVEEPESITTKGSFVGSKTYLTYKVVQKVKGRDACCKRHRYSDFENLRKTLKERYISLGIFIPNLPPKHLTIATNATAVEDPLVRERILGLTSFCEQVVSSPWLRNDDAWKSFMRTDASVNNAVEGGVENVGELMLFRALNQLQAPSKDAMLESMTSIKTEVAVIEKIVRSFMEQARLVQMSERALETANKGLGSHFAAWVREEKRCSHYLGNSAFNVAAQCRFPEHSSFSLVAILEQELTAIESLKELLSAHATILSMIQSAVSKLAKTQMSKAKNKLQLVQEYQQTIEDKELCLAAFHKGFVHFTMPAYARLRAASVRRFSGALAAASLCTSYSLLANSRDFFAALNIRPQSAISETGTLLSLLAMQQLDVPQDDVLAPTKPLLPAKEASQELTLARFSAAMLFDEAVKVSATLQSQSDKDRIKSSSSSSSSFSSSSSSSNSNSNSSSSSSTDTDQEQPQTPAPPAAPSPASTYTSGSKYVEESAGAVGGEEGVEGGDKGAVSAAEAVATEGDAPW